MAPRIVQKRRRGTYQSPDQLGGTSHSVNTLESVFRGKLSGFHESLDGDLFLYAGVVRK